MQIEHYSVHLCLSASSDDIKGKVNIGAVPQSGEELELDAVDTQINSVKINGKPEKFRYDEKASKLKIQADCNGPCDLEIDFVSKVSETLQGLYRIKVGDNVFLTTQFEPEGARYLFPCFDNPAYKAEFRLTVGVDAEMDAISNMPQKGKTIVSGQKTIEFEATPRMSTYLLYLGIGNFEELTDKMGSTDVILTGPKNLFHSNNYPLKSAIDSLRYFEEYFDIPYQLPKLHLISVPDFSAGAMENWGAITFRQVYLEMDEKSSMSVKMLIESVIAHEEAHQWFGNLVTMKWWNDLWLNESFATFMSYKALSKIRPQYEIMQDMVEREKGGALRADSLHSTHPIEADVKSPDEVAQIFDEISYGKGGNVLRMLESFIGQDKFRDGIREYLKKFSFGNATGSDLWETLGNVSGQPVPKIMDAWIKQEGYPVINVALNGSAIRLTQSRFTLLENKDETLWPIPLIVVRDGGEEHILMESKTIDIPARGFVKIDSKAVGFYRVNYDPALQTQVLMRLKYLDPLDKWSLLSDSYSMLLAGKLTFDRYKEIVKRFENEPEPMVMNAITTQLSTLHSIDPENQDLKTLLVSVLTKFLKTLGEKKEGEKFTVTSSRSSISATLAHTDKDYADSLAANFDSFDSFDPDLKLALAFAAAKSFNSAEKLLSKLKEVGSEEERENLTLALGYTEGKENFEAVSQAMHDGTVKKQDIILVALSLATNPGTRDLLFEAYSDVLELLEKYLAGLGQIGMFVERSAPLLGLGREEKMREILFTIHFDEASNGIKKGLEYLDIYSGLRKHLNGGS